MSRGRRHSQAREIGTTFDKSSVNLFLLSARDGLEGSGVNDPLVVHEMVTC